MTNGKVGLSRITDIEPPFARIDHVAGVANGGRVMADQVCSIGGTPIVVEIAAFELTASERLAWVQRVETDTVCRAAASAA